MAVSRSMPISPAHGAPCFHKQVSHDQVMVAEKIQVWM